MLNNVLDELNDFIRPHDGCGPQVVGSHPADACRPPSALCSVGAGPTSWTALPTSHPTDGHASPPE